ncbi:MAG: hypothetical protein JJT78_10545 [Leptospira sp.]|nr:hypothetical protein [Leptospira sp.]
MIFKYDRKGLPDAPEVYIFQDLFDTPRNLRELGKILEPHFHVLYFYLPESSNWLKPDSLENLQNIAIDEIHPILQENENQKYVILGGMSFAFWRKIFLQDDNLITSAYLFSPEWDLLGSMGTFLEVLKTYWDKKGFYLLDWIAAQPIAHHLSFAQSQAGKAPNYNLKFLRTDKSRQKFYYETKTLLEKYHNAQWNSFPLESDESLKTSLVIKKYLLMNLAKDSNMKLDKVWADILTL